MSTNTIEATTNQATTIKEWTDTDQLHKVNILSREKERLHLLFQNYPITDAQDSFITAQSIMDRYSETIDDERYLTFTNKKSTRPQRQQDGTVTFPEVHYRLRIHDDNRNSILKEIQGFLGKKTFTDKLDGVDTSKGELSPFCLGGVIVVKSGQRKIIVGVVCDQLFHKELIAVQNVSSDKYLELIMRGLLITKLNQDVIVSTSEKFEAIPSDYNLTLDNGDNHPINNDKVLANSKYRQLEGAKTFLVRGIIESQCFTDTLRAYHLISQSGQSPVQKVRESLKTSPLFDFHGKIHNCSYFELNENGMEYLNKQLAIVQESLFNAKTIEELTRELDVLKATNKEQAAAYNNERAKLTQRIKDVKAKAKAEALKAKKDKQAS